MNNKIINFNDVENLINDLKLNNKNIVHCHGVFDLLHIGHIKHFEEAKSFGDILIVSITPDIYVNKGINRPAFNEKLRAEALSSLTVIDYVLINKWPTAVEIINIIQPDIYCKGTDYKNHSKDITAKINEEADTVTSVGGIIKYTSDLTFSSSKLINSFGDLQSDNQKSFIKTILEKNDIDSIIDIINKVKKLKILVIGEIIIDQYTFCEALGKSGKEPVLALRDLNTETYAGGAAAIANHLSEFSDYITLLSMLGEDKEHEKFILKNLGKNIQPQFIYKKNSPTITKKRFLDHISNNKVLGIYSINDSQLEKENEEKLKSALELLIPDHDLVIISDYGHGFLSKETAKIISGLSIFTSLNAQINAANIGYHTMNNYNEINCVIINETELRYELRDRISKLNDLLRILSEKLKIETIIVTQGSKGATLYNSKNDKFYKCPAFASKIVDKIGSGDTMLALISCMLKVNADFNLALYISSLAAAQTVEIIGNKSSVNKIQLLRSLQYSLK